MGIETLKGIGFHNQLSDPKSEAGGYNTFKNALRQKIVTDTKIDSQSDEGALTREARISGKEDTQGVQNLFVPLSNAAQTHEEMTVK